MKKTYNKPVCSKRYVKMETQILAGSGDIQYGGKTGDGTGFNGKVD